MAFLTTLYNVLQWCSAAYESRMRTRASCTCFSSEDVLLELAFSLAAAYNIIALWRRSTSWSVVSSLRTAWKTRSFTPTMTVRPHAGHLGVVAEIIDDGKRKICAAPVPCGSLTCVAEQVYHRASPGQKSAIKLSRAGFPFDVVGMLQRDHPAGYVVGDTRLQIHLFRPDVPRPRAIGIEHKIGALLDALSSCPEAVTGLQVRGSGVLECCTFTDMHLEKVVLLFSDGQRQLHGVTGT